MVIWRELVTTVREVLQLGSIAEITIVRLTTYNPVVCIIGEVERADQNRPLVLLACPCSVIGISVADGVAAVTAEAKTETFDRIVVDTQGKRILVGHVELQTTHPYESSSRG